ncbi:MAG: hypothetical protein HKO57_11155, partial [Akkermansiaceae bacterium]|nr:hypothetical protein [Akkermansiaceae bacterium]
LYFRAVHGRKITAVNAHTFDVDGIMTIETGKGGGAPFVRDKDLVVPVDLTGGEAAIQLRYTWN